MRDLNMDLRVVRTKALIVDALTELIDEKGFEAITVKDITTRANINRGTFYSHYQDKYDLMDKCQQEIMYNMAIIVKKDVANILAKGECIPSTTPPFSFTISVCEYLHQHRRVMKAMLGTKGDPSFQTTLKNFMWRELFESHEDLLIKQGSLRVPVDYLSSYIASAHLGVIQQWLQDDGRESPSEMAKILSTMTVNGPFFAAGLKK
ncbi:TetR/AcrR family transcriptional regulator [Priestia filamentosa]|uniref:TetR/AcrR family transcriptional regulator n=1 Tax=Priestia filamentosa TaxID=1402861 RepID=UPI00397A0961